MLRRGTLVKRRESIARQQECQRFIIALPRVERADPLRARRFNGSPRRIVDKETDPLNTQNSPLSAFPASPPGWFARGRILDLVFAAFCPCFVPDRGWPASIPFESQYDLKDGHRNLRLLPTHAIPNSELCPYQRQSGASPQFPAIRKSMPRQWLGGQGAIGHPSATIPYSRSHSPLHGFLDFFPQNGRRLVGRCPPWI
jgi:hypothetical protein